MEEDKKSLAFPSIVNESKNKQKSELISTEDETKHYIPVLENFMNYYFLVYVGWPFNLLPLTLSLLLTTLEAFVDSVDQDQTAHNVKVDL